MLLFPAPGIPISVILFILYPFKALIGTNGIDTSKAINSNDVKVGDKSGNQIEAGNKFELSMKSFKVGDADYVMFVVTCKAQVKAAG